MKILIITLSLFSALAFAQGENSSTVLSAACEEAITTGCEPCKLQHCPNQYFGEGPKNLAEGQGSKKKSSGAVSE
jgi:hypothetical protein